MIKRTMTSGKSFLRIYASTASFVVLRIAMSNRGSLTVDDGKQFLACSQRRRVTLLCFLLQQALAASTYKLALIAHHLDQILDSVTAVTMSEWCLLYWRLLLALRFWSTPL